HGWAATPSGDAWRAFCTVTQGAFLRPQRSPATHDSTAMATTSWQPTTLVKCVSIRPWLVYPGWDRPGGCHDLTRGKTYEMLSVEGSGSFYRIIDDSGEDYLYPVSHFKPL